MPEDVSDQRFARGTPFQRPAVASGKAALRALTFRWWFVYVVAYCAVCVTPGLSPLPGMSRVTQAPQLVTHRVVPWVGRHVLHLKNEITTFDDGTGDTTFDYILTLCLVAFALLVAVAWSVLDRKRTEYSRLHDWLRVGVRYGLAIVMLDYGIAKIINIQFPSPNLERLLEPYGDSSPQGLLWTFMGYSKPYTALAGAIETTGALLLLSRRTTLVGSLLLVISLTNVVALNFAYDVPVKLYSTHLLILALFLVLPDAKRLASVLVSDRPIRTSPRAIVKWLLIGALLVMVTRNFLHLKTVAGDDTPIPPLYGIYDVETFSRNGVEVPPLLTDGRRWRRVVFNRFGGLSVYAPDGQRQGYAVKVDIAKKIVTVSTGMPSKVVMSFTFVELPHNEGIIIDGQVGSDTIQARLHRLDESSFVLLNDPYHWITNEPHSR